MNPRQTPHVPRSSSKPTILVVDDSPENLTLLVAILKSDYRVLVATHGQKALEIARSENSPDLILLDVMMPEMDGHEVCQRLKASAKTAHIPVIFVTGLEEANTRQFLAEWGAEGCISKPIQPELLRSKVAEYLPRSILGVENSP
ncbi:MAG: response regulator [Prochlorothrix sp.]|nr:response regulator [Prochlorothrix sp.]